MCVLVEMVLLNLLVVLDRHCVGVCLPRVGLLFSLSILTYVPRGGTWWLVSVLSVWEQALEEVREN
jgi:hypothetical protein